MCTQHIGLIKGCNKGLLLNSINCNILWTISFSSLLTSRFVALFPPIKAAGAPRFFLQYFAAVVRTSRCLSGTNSWQVVSPGGAVVQGGYGHSSVYDEASRCVFVHGGYKALGSNKYGLVDHMYRYHVRTKTW